MVGCADIRKLGDKELLQALDFILVLENLFAEELDRRTTPPVALAGIQTEPQFGPKLIPKLREERVWGKDDAEVFRKTICKIGCEKVMALGIMVRKNPLVRASPPPLLEKYPYA